MTQAGPPEAPTLTRRRRILFVLMTIGLALIVIAVVLELGLRVFGVRPDTISPLSEFHRPDPVIGFRGKPNLDERWTRPEFYVRVVHDENGYRKHKTPEPADAAAPAIHAFGDSFTWGWGVDHGEVYADQLSALKRDHRVRNYGRNGLGTASQYWLFRDEVRGSLRAGDVVLLAFYTNDYADNFDERQVHLVETNGGYELLPASRHRNFENWEMWLKKRSALYSWIAHQLAFRRQIARNRENRGVVPQVGTAEFGGQYTRAVEHCLRLLRDDCRAKGARLVVLSIPEALEMEGSGAPIPARRALATTCRALEILVVDPTEALRRLNKTKPAYIHADGHWTAAAHREVAFVLAESLGL